MTKYKEVDYKAPKSRWPLWVIPFLVAILLLLIGIFIFVTLSAKHHCLFFDCEQRKIDDGGLLPPDQKPRQDDELLPPTGEPSSSRGTKNETGEADSANKMTVHGELVFEGSAPDRLPANSYLKVDFEDVSLMDASSVLLGTTVVDLSSYNKATNLKFEIKCKKPNPHGRYSLSAVLNMGWQADENSWIKPGDFHTDTHHNVKIEDGKSEYKKDITLVRYN